MSITRVGSIRGEDFVMFHSHLWGLLAAVAIAAQVGCGNGKAAHDLVAIHPEVSGVIALSAPDGTPLDSVELSATYLADSTEGSLCLALRRGESQSEYALTVCGSLANNIVVIGESLQLLGSLLLRPGDLDMPAKDNPAELILVPFGRGCEVQVVDQTGRPQSNVQVRIMPSYEEWEWMKQLSPTNYRADSPEDLLARRFIRLTDANGMALFEALPVLDSEEGTEYEICIDSTVAFAGPEHVVVMGDETGRVTIHAVALNRVVIEGEVTDVYGRPLSDVEVLSSSGAQQSSDPKGHWRMMGIGKLPEFLWFKKASYSAASIKITGEMLARRDAMSYQIVLDVQRHVGGVVADVQGEALCGVMVQLTTDDGLSFRSLTDQSGRFEFAKAPTAAGWLSVVGSDATYSCIEMVSQRVSKNQHEYSLVARRYPGCLSQVSFVGSVARGNDWVGVDDAIIACEDGLVSGLRLCQTPHIERHITWGGGGFIGLHEGGWQAWVKCHGGAWRHAKFTVGNVGERLSVPVPPSSSGGLKIRLGATDAQIGTMRGVRGTLMWRDSIVRSRRGQFVPIVMLRAASDINGELRFSNLTPGEYCFVVEPDLGLFARHSPLIVYPGKDTEYEVVLEAGMITRFEGVSDAGRVWILSHSPDFTNVLAIGGTLDDIECVLPRGVTNWHLAVIRARELGTVEYKGEVSPTEVSGGEAIESL